LTGPDVSIRKGGIVAKSDSGVQPVQPAPKGAGKDAAQKQGPERRKRPLFDLVPGLTIDDYFLPHIGVWLVGLASLAPGRWLAADVLARWLIFVVVAVAFLVVLPYVAWNYSSGARSSFQRVHAVVSCVLVGLGALGTMLVGLTGWWIVIFLGAGHTLALSWNIRRADVIRGEGRDGHGDGLGWDEALDLKGSKATIVEDNEVRRRIRVTGVNGQGVADIRAKLPRIVAAAKGLRGSGRVIDRPHENEADIVIVKKDILKKSPADFPWNGQRRSFADGATLALSQMGVTITVHLAGGKNFGPTNLQVMGMTRAGKSHFFRLFAREVSRTDDAVLWVVDLIKGRQTLPPVAPAVDWFVEDRDEARVLLQGLKDRVIPARADYLGSIDLDEWEPGCGLAALIVWIEEAAQAGLGDLYTRVVETCLSVGIFLVDSMQRADHQNKPTGARAQMAAAVCFGVQSKTDSGMVLPDDVNEQSLADVWQNTKQGACYIVAPGIPAELRGIECRTPWVERDKLTAEIANNARGMCQLDDVTEQAMGAPYAERELFSKVIDEHGRPVRVSTAVRRKLDQIAGRTTPTTTGPTAQTSPVRPAGQTAPTTYEDGDQMDDRTDDDQPIEIDESDPAVANPALPVAYQGAENDMVQVDPRAELAPVPGEAAGVSFIPQDQAERLEGPARHEAWQRCLAQVAADGQTEADGSIIVTTADLCDAWLGTPGVDSRMRPWMHARIDSLIEAGLAERVEPEPGVPGRGKYRLSARHDWSHPSPPVVDEDGADADVSGAPGGAFSP
jgi:hypothetical protein